MSKARQCAVEWWTRGKPSVLGTISGAAVGLGTITPGSGFVLPMHGVIIGLLAAGVCFWACNWLKIVMGYGDSLDVFGVHGIGGLTGTPLAGVFAVAAVSVSPDVPGGIPGPLEGNSQQLLIQFYGVSVTIVWPGGMTFLILKLVGAMIPRRVGEMDERQGLDVSLHDAALQ
jgi:Amt family ammonium transporter